MDSMFISSATTGSMFFIDTSAKTMATVAQDGTVEIDWTEVEKSAADSGMDLTVRAMARIMVAVRDGTWVPIGHGKPRGEAA